MRALLRLLTGSGAILAATGTLDLARARFYTDRACPVRDARPNWSIRRLGMSGLVQTTREHISVALLSTVLGSACGIASPLLHLGQEEPQVVEGDGQYSGSGA